MSYDKPTTAYQVIESTDLETVQSVVNDFVGMGYQPQGGLVAYKDDDDDLHFAQAVVRLLRGESAAL